MAGSIERRGGVRERRTRPRAEAPRSTRRDLSSLAHELGYLLEGSGDDVPVHGIATRADDVAAGDLLAATSATSAQDIEFAKARGASGLIAVAPPPVTHGLPVLCARPNEGVLSSIERAIYGDASCGLKIAVVTGRDREDAAILLAQVLEASAGPTKLFVQEGADAPRIRKVLARHRNAGGELAVIQIDADTAARGGLAGLPIDVLLHTGPASSSNAKSDWIAHEQEQDLVRRVGSSGAVVLARDVASTEEYQREAIGRVVGYALERRTDVTATIRRCEAERSVLDLRTPLGMATLRLNTGHHGFISAALGAMTTALTMEVPLDRAVAALGDAAPRPGRHERLLVPRPYEVWIGDDARADLVQDNLAAVPTADGARKWVIVGCPAGVTPREARLFGLTLAREADVIVLTGPERGVPPAMTTIQALTAALPSVGQILVERDRDVAIRRGLESLAKGDVLYILGRGDRDHDRAAVTDWFLQALIG